MSDNKKLILLVDDEQHILNALHRLLRLHGFETSCHLHTDEALLELRQRKFDLVISDQQMPGMKGTEFLIEATRIDPNLQCILLSGYNVFDDVITAFNKGLIRRFIEKPWNNTALINEIEEILQGEASHSEENRPIPSTQKNLNETPNVQVLKKFEKIVSQSVAMDEVISRIRKVANTNMSVLLTGETGTGKDLVAMEIHEASARKNKEFVAVNCANFSEENLELMLFGREHSYARNSSPDRSHDQVGLLAMAHKGTLYLDGVTTIPINLQAKLLRLIEDKDFSPLGSTKKIPIDVRLITSTNQCIEKASRDGLFREDLRYRLDVINIALPPLRERVDDILPLFKTFLGKALGEYDVKNTEIDALLTDCLQHYNWPGNVRELENLCSNIGTRVDSDYNYISVSSLPDQILEPVLEDYDASADMLKLDQLEKCQLQRLINEFPGRTDSAAKFVGVSGMALLKKAKKLGLHQ